MGLSKFTKMTGVCLLSLGLTILPFSISASAQDTTLNDSPAVENIEFDWGWLGLLGLLGLAGLAGRKRTEDRYLHHEDRRDQRTGVLTPQINPSTNPPANSQADVPRYRDPYSDPKS